ncbi:hypothetical protein J4573_43375 [Actinomadura barringtoniae]|uniref:Uncharacterized protein n=1 Tax=Actinomadura barringtoniae TaxID=1427535 RepID=A0A939PPV0_9ACTN|nr:hypothetical protein [Actinomadura barringtoniae]MBO2453993.1 hypothetical protein [Actinomadura barringtoniae]
MRAASVLVAVCAGAVALALALRGDAALAFDAVFVAFGAVVVRVVWDIRRQQRRILDQLEIQTRVLHNAARLAAQSLEEPRDQGPRA